MASEQVRTLHFKGKLVVQADVVAVTGLHIGGGSERFEIGGIDNPVIKDARGVPYIPGSSLKGKLRSLLERLDRRPPNFRINNGFIHVCQNAEEYQQCWVCRLFGVPAQEFNEPTRLIVRDAPLDESSITDEMRGQLELPYTEIKSENSLDRLTSAANPRQMERVPAGARFRATLIVTLYEKDDAEYLRRLLAAMQLLEHDALGGSGSRGSGQVSFENLAIRWYPRDEYLSGQVRPDKAPINGDAATVSAVLGAFDRFAAAIEAPAAR